MPPSGLCHYDSQCDRPIRIFFLVTSGGVSVALASHFVSVAGVAIAAVPDVASPPSSKRKILQALSGRRFAFWTYKVLELLPLQLFKFAITSYRSHIVVLTTFDGPHNIPLINL